MLLAVHLKSMDFSVEGLAYLTCRTREVDDQPVWVHGMYAKAVRPQPAGDGVNILLSQTVPRSQLLRRQPMMKVGGFQVVQSIDQLFQRLFQIGTASFRERA